MKRLLDFAREATKHEPHAARVMDFADIGSRLHASPAVMTNWKARGISKEGALDAQLAFGCNALWLLSGEGSPTIRPAWPFSRQLLLACQAADTRQLRQVENAARVVLGLDTLPMETAAAA